MGGNPAREAGKPNRTLEASLNRGDWLPIKFDEASRHKFSRFPAPLQAECDTDTAITAALAQRFPASKLFVERAVASGAHLDLSDAEAAIVAEICRSMALAIELAARRAGVYGLQQTAALLNQRLTLLRVGGRTAPPRQKTLQATLDWSYERLYEQSRLQERSCSPGMMLWRLREC
jgi:predicted ATPase